MTTREIALRCAAAMNPNLLRHNWPCQGDKREMYGFTKSSYATGGMALIRQLGYCKSEEARRLLLGRSA